MVTVLLWTHSKVSNFSIPAYSPILVPQSNTTPVIPLFQYYAKRDLEAANIVNCNIFQLCFLELYVTKIFEVSILFVGCVLSSLMTCLS